MNKSKRLLISFSLAAFLNDVGAHIVRPLWPAFITIVLGAPASFLGLIEGAGQATSALSRYPAGRWADTNKKKPLIWLGYLFSGFARVGYAISNFAGVLLLFHVLDRAGKGIREPPRDALLAHEYKKQRGKAFGILEGVDHLGAAVGPLVGALLFAVLSYRYTFAIAAIPSTLGGLIIWKMTQEKKTKQIKSQRFKFKEYPKAFKVLTAASALFALSWFSVSFFILRVNQIGLPTWLLPVFYLFYVLPAAGSTYTFGKLSDKIGRKLILLLAFSLFGASCLGFMLFTQLWTLSVFFVLFGIQYGIMVSVPKTFASDLVSERHRPSALGIYDMVFWFMTMPASLIAGALWDAFGSMATFGYGLAVSLVSACIFWIVVRPKS